MTDDNSPIEKKLDSVFDDIAFSSDQANLNRTMESSPAADVSNIDSTSLPQVETSDEETRQQLVEELDQLVERIRQVTPDYSPPPFSFQALVKLTSEYISRLSPGTGLSLLEQFRLGMVKDLFDLDTWQGIWYVINYSISAQKELINRRVSGQFDTNEWGYDSDVVEAVKPFFQFLYKRYWRVQVSGIENIPDEGRALLVANHSGQLPFDGSMVGMAVLNEHPGQRMVRTLYASWFPTLPMVSTVFVKLGQTLANEENGIRLLEEDQLVAVYPEGIKGVSKLYKERYRLARFGRGGFVQMALKTGSPMIPVSIVGAEETYVSLSKSDFIARLIGFPFFPITTTFPWLGLFGLIPLPSKWYIDFGKPIATDIYGAKSANNVILVSQLTDQMRNLVQNMLYIRLAERKSVLFG